jgi:hypothetical protein
LPLKLSVTAFCQGLPGSINAVLIPCATSGVDVGWLAAVLRVMKALA